MTEAPYPKRGGKGRQDSLPAEMPGVRTPLLKPYGGLTYEEWMATPLPKSQFQDNRPMEDQEIVGKKIQNLSRELDIGAAAAADSVLGDQV
jgi:hypothetical protein